MAVLTFVYPWWLHGIEGEDCVRYLREKKEENYSDKHIQPSERKREVAYVYSGDFLYIQGYVILSLLVKIMSSHAL